MNKPKTYRPLPGWRYQIFMRAQGAPAGNHPWQSIGYARYPAELDAKLNALRATTPHPIELWAIQLPERCWPE